MRRFRLTVDAVGHGVLFDLDRNEQVHGARAVTVIAEIAKPTRMIVEYVAVEIEVDMGVDEANVEERHA
jgi:hypothetical protein